MKDGLRDFIQNGEPIPSDLYNEKNGFLLTKIAGEYLDNGDAIRAMLALNESKKCHENMTVPSKPFNISDKYENNYKYGGDIL